MERGRTGKRRGNKKTVSERFLTCKSSSGKLGLRLLAVSAFRGFWGVKPRRKKNTGGNWRFLACHADVSLMLDVASFPVNSMPSTEQESITQAELSCLKVYKR
jgi:hypothetical protein